MDWEGIAVSPTGALIAVQNSAHYRLYEIDPKTGKMRLIHDGGSLGFNMPDEPTWLTPEVLLLETWDKDGVDAGKYAANIKTGAWRRVVPRQNDEWTSGSVLVPSPSGKLLATDLDVTAAEWLSVSEVASGRTLWRTNPKEGMEGFSGMTWSRDNKSLFVSFLIDNEMASGSPGGLWKFDALTGKQHLWKYRKRSVDGVWGSPERGLLAVDVGNRLEFLRMDDGKLLFKLPESNLGSVIEVFFLGSARILVSGDRGLAEVNASGKAVRTYTLNKGFYDGSVGLKYSASRDAVMYGRNGVLDLKTGKITKFGRAVSDATNVEWLSKDVVH
jgi:hypothetical protein